MGVLARLLFDGEIRTQNERVIRVRMKQRIASSGVHTMGSFSLKLVFSTTGTPCAPGRAS